MKKFTYWLLGEKAGRFTESKWKWLWGISPESREVLKPLIQKYEQTRQAYEGKLRELQRCDRQVLSAQRNGDVEAMHSASLQVTQLETLLPQLEEQVKQAEQSMIEMKLEA